MSAPLSQAQPRSSRRLTPLLLESATIASAMKLLSLREQQIAMLVARGYSNKEIARELDISPWTVSAHLRRVFAKLDISKRMELCMMVFSMDEASRGGRH